MDRFGLGGLMSCSQGAVDRSPDMGEDVAIPTKQITVINLTRNIVDSSYFRTDDVVMM